MISKSRIKFVQSLKQKKYRDLHRCFVAEGSKLVLELAESRFSVRQIFATTEWFRDNLIAPEIPVEMVKPFEMERISTLSTPSPVLAVVEMPEEKPESTSPNKDLTLVLDGMHDPGNMGAIIRIADWFGIQEVICSTDSVDLYNSKVIQASMGSITRVKVSYVELTGFFESLEKGVPVYGMMLEGENIFISDIKPNGIIVIGSEAHGISDKVVSFITDRVTIPFYPSKSDYHAESLNVAVATGIVCAEFRKRLALRDRGCA